MKLPVCLFALTLLAGIVPSQASAAVQEAAPGMAGVKEVLVQFARISNSRAATYCGIGREELAVQITKALKVEGVPAFLVSEAKPADPNIARIVLIPDIAVLSPSSAECTSWIALNAQSSNVVRIPPVETPRNVTITYWRSGQILTSGQVNHSSIVTDLFERLAKSFAKQYQVDQPPPLPNLEVPKELKLDRNSDPLLGR